MNKVEFAMRLATMMHHNQTYGDNEPYTTHLKAVASTLRDFGFVEEKYKVSAWLHDIVEDTKITTKDIEVGFDKEISEIVSAVTNVTKGGSPKERFEKTYLNIAGNRDAIIVKLADRISNVSQSLKDNTKHGIAYRKAWPLFYKILYDASEKDPRVTSMWAHLSNLQAKLNGVLDDRKK